MKYFRFLLLFPILFTSSCNKYYTEEVILNTETIYYTVLSKDWILMDVPPSSSEDEDSQWTYFYCEFREPVLTNKIFNSGMMDAYLTDGGDRSRITPLPFDNFFRVPNGGFMWTEQVTCEFSPGRVTFIAKYNDFDMTFAPPTYTFMVRYAW